MASISNLVEAFPPTCGKNAHLTSQKMQKLVTFFPGMTRIFLFGRQPIKTTKSFLQPRPQRKAPCCLVATIGPFTTTQSPVLLKRASQLC